MPVEVVSRDTEVVTLGEIIKTRTRKKARHIYFAMIVRTSFQLVELNRISTSVRSRLMFVSSTACIGLIIGFVIFVCDLLSVTAVC